MVWIPPEHLRIGVTKTFLLKKLFYIDGMNINLQERLMIM